MRIREINIRRRKEPNCAVNMDAPKNGPCLLPAPRLPGRLGMEMSVPQLTRAELEPFRRILISRQEAIDEVLAICCHSMSEVPALPRLVAAMEMARKGLGAPPTEDHEERMKQAHRFAEIARREVDAGFPRLHEMGTVLLWGALEAAVKDFAVQRLIVHAELRATEHFSKVHL